MKLHKTLIILTLFVTSFMMLGTQFSAVAAGAGKGKEWRVSPRKAKIKNPQPADDASIKLGSSIYVRECQNCHGKSGKGDGPEAADLDKPVPDFNSEKMWAQSDGSVAWKIRSGRRPMPSFKKMLSKDEIWHVTNFLRKSFSKK